MANSRRSYRTAHSKVGNFNSYAPGRVSLSEIESAYQSQLRFFGDTDMTSWLTGLEGAFALKLAVCLVLGTAIGAERELRNKPAGISTHCFVMAGACLFMFISTLADPNNPVRIAAQVVSGVGFLGAGMILKSENNTIKNLTTAAAVWFAAAIGMAIGIGWYVIAAIAAVYAIAVPRIPHVKTWMESQNDE
jgi:putative Mg2+ transporter-C (MgtC) family protein